MTKGLSKIKINDNYLKYKISNIKNINLSYFFYNKFMPYDSIEYFYFFYKWVVKSMS
jgi:hypothetical protein